MDSHTKRVMFSSKIVEDAERYRYCPHCGAKMEERKL